MSLRDRTDTHLTPQQARVLAAARHFNGTCQADWVQDLGADGLGKITRLAARIGELDELGYCFECIGWRSKTKVWRLVSEPAGVVAGAAPPKLTATGTVGGAGQSTGSLFEVGEPQMGAYEWEVHVA